MIKTLYEDIVEDVFLKSVQKYGRPQFMVNTPILGAWFYIASTQKEKDFKHYYFTAEDEFIFCRKKPESQELVFMNVEFSFLRKTNDKVINNKKFFGLKFVKRKTFEELFHEKEEVIDLWYEHFKEFCVLTKFRLYFKSIKVLGKGSFAKVFKVQRFKDDQKFAVKVFNKKLIMQDDLERQCLLYEIKMMRIVKNKRILRMYELYEGENFIYCLCDLFQGEDLLNAIIKKGKQTEQKALAILTQILEGLIYLHSLNIIHRDLKPENILFRHKDTIDIGIVDLGFATLERDYQSLFVRCGTPGYVAPEVLNDLPYDCKVDVYSAGIITYIMLVNKTHWQVAFQRKKLQRHSIQKYEGENQFRNFKKFESFRLKLFNKPLICYSQCCTKIRKKDALLKKL